MRSALTVLAILLTAGAQLPLVDLAGRSIDLQQVAGPRATVFLLARTDCPISNRYAPELRRLHQKFASRGVAFWLVYPDPDEPPDAVRRHLREYGYPFGALRDPQHAFVRLIGATVTPEAAVFVPGRADPQLVYRGRIDDRYVEFGKMRPAPTRRDLEQALEAVLDGTPVASATLPAIGCRISDLR
jgi:peroxiredoxin